MPASSWFPIVDLRSLSLAEAGRHSLDVEPVDLCALLTTVKASFETKASRAQVHPRLSACKPTIVDADAERVLQIVEHFMSNAVRHTPPGG